MLKNDLFYDCNQVVFLKLPGIKQTAKLVNSTLMELINCVEDNPNDTKEDIEVMQILKTKLCLYI